jgi:hypothetical protein
VPTPDTVSVYQRPDPRELRTSEPWCVTALDGTVSTTTRHPTRDAAQAHADHLTGVKS